MYAAPMKRVAYQYKTGNNVDGSPAAYGQIFKVRYWDGTAQNAGNGVMVSTLDITAYNVRKETRGDTKWRTFSYGIRDTNLTGHLMSCTDFMDHLSASQTYDGKNYVNSVTDRNGHRTDYTNNPITGNITEIQYPFTHGDTPNQSQRPTVDYTYTNSYYLGSVRDEGNHTITILRDMNNRITEIDYPDGGWETFTSYDGFNQSRSHRMTTGGTETFTFDSSNGRKLTYRNPDNPSGNPTAQYFYDARGRLSGVLDVLSHSTNFDYNDRGQLTVTTLPWIDQQRYTITNAYNPDGTLQNKTDELGQMTSYTYDDYRRLTSVTSPARGDGSGTHTTSYYYDVNGVTDDYKYTDSNVTYVTLPTGKKIKTVYDDNRRKSSVSLAPGTVDEATTGYVYDDVGNVRIVTNPRTYATTTAYDERNRPSSVTQPLTQTTTFTYDPAGRKKTVTRPNGQVITYEEYDAMNRLKRQRVTQTPSSDAVTKYEYYAPGEGQPVGLLHSMEDPRLVGTNSSEKYQYTYDLMGRKAWVWYPKDSYNQNRSEHFTYDAAGRLETFKNRTGNVETFTYDALNRMIHSEWDDGSTPAVNFLYDAASRLTDINNVNATIHR